MSENKEMPVGNQFELQSVDMKELIAMTNGLIENRKFGEARGVLLTVLLSMGDVDALTDKYKAGLIRIYSGVVDAELADIALNARNCLKAIGVTQQEILFAVKGSEAVSQVTVHTAGVPNGHIN